MSMLTPIARRRRSPSLVSLFDDLFQDFFAEPSSDRRWAAPPLNVVENDKSFTLEFELPGLDQKDIQVQVNDDQLTINAERKFEAERKEGEYHRVEHRYGKFTRSLTLPREIDADKVDAAYKNGVLTVVLPKSETTSSKRINVRGE